MYYITFGILLVVIVALTWLDPKEEIRLLVVAWPIVACGAFVSMGIREIPPEDSARLATAVYLGAIVGTGFRPGRVCHIPRRDENGSTSVSDWIRFLGGWVGASVSVWCLAAQIFD